MLRSAKTLANVDDSHRGCTRPRCVIAATWLTRARCGNSPPRLPPSGSDQSTTDRVDHRLETVVGAELLVHVVEVIAKRLR